MANYHSDFWRREFNICAMVALLLVSAVTLFVALIKIVILKPNVLTVKNSVVEQ